MPVTNSDRVFSRPTGDADSRIVLLCAVDVVRKFVVDRDAIKLRGRLVLLGPTPAAVEGNIRAAVVALDHAVRIVGRDPQIVVVAVRHGDRRVRAAAVVGSKEADVQNVN